MRTRLLGTVTLALALAACPVRAESADEIWRGEVSRLASPLIDAGLVPGMAVGIYDGGRTETYFLGVADPSAAAPVPPAADTIYEIGSISKVFTALLLADAAGRGEVKADDPLSALLPDGVEAPRRDGKEITLEHLATHFSGLPRLPDNMRGETLEDPYAGYTRENLFDFINGHRLGRAPGATYEYSNLGVGLLGTLLAQRGGSDYDALLRDRIAGPLGMTDTGVGLSPDQQRRLAPPHRGGLRVGNWGFDALAGCGGVRSTVHDMLLFMAAHVEPESTALRAAIVDASRRRRDVADTPWGMALGWHVAGDRSTLWHTGQTGGYSAAVFVNAAGKKGVVVLANGADSTVDALAERIIQAVFGMKVDPPKVRPSIPLADAQLEPLVGDYPSPIGLTMSIRRHNDALMAQLTGQPALRIFPESPTLFFYREVEAEIEFEVDADTKSAGALTLFQNGQKLRFERRR